MKKHFRPLLALLVIVLTSLACSSSFQVVETPSSSPVQENVPTEAATALPNNLLPHPLYFFGKDSQSLTQIYRIERVFKRGKVARRGPRGRCKE